MINNNSGNKNKNATFCRSMYIFFNTNTGQCIFFIDPFVINMGQCIFF